MPWIDVSDVISDPMVAGETFQVIRRTETINSLGESTITTQTYNAVGQVAPTPNNKLLRKEGFSTQEKTLQVITNFILYGPSIDTSNNQYQPDIIVWKGSYYIVDKIEDFSHYGVGMVVADCSSYDYIVKD